MSPLVYGKIAVVAVVALYVMFLKLEIADQNTQIETYKSNQIALKLAVKTAKETQAFTAGLLEKSQEASNEHFKAIETANSSYIAAVSANGDLQRKLDQAIRVNPVVAAGDVNGRTASLLTAFWRQRRAYYSANDTDHSKAAIDRPADDGSPAKSPDIRGNQ